MIRAVRPCFGQCNATHRNAVGLSESAAACAPPNQTLKVTGAAISVSRDIKVLKAAPGV